MPNSTIVNIDELMMGIQEETEHTEDLKTRLTIALQHLSEDPQYYTKLKSAMKGVTKAMPKPNAGEKRSEFVSRCVKEVMGEGTDQKAAVGKCEGIFNEAKKSAHSKALVFKAAGAVAKVCKMLGIK